MNKETRVNVISSLLTLIVMTITDLVFLSILETDNFINTLSSVDNLIVMVVVFVIYPMLTFFWIRFEVRSTIK